MEPESGMNWIERHQLTLKAISAVCGLAAATLILWHFFRYAGQPASWRGYQIGLFALPWLIGTAAFTPLIYLSWFKDAKPGFFRIMLKVFFWFCVACEAIVFVGIYGVVFR
jgi:hypothetical protein